MSLGVGVNNLAFPFSVLPNGTVATVSQGSDAWAAQLIGAIVLTRYGECELVPSFGTSDPIMVGINPTEVAAQVAAFGPPVQIKDVIQIQQTYDTAAVQIEFA